MRSPVLRVTGRALALVLTVAMAATACGGSDEVAEPATTTIVELFGDTSTTTTIGRLAVPGWTFTELPDLWEAVGECVDLTEVGAEPLPTEGQRTVIVESGDSLGKIAKRFDRTVDQFMRANGISDPNLLKVGQVLIVPRQQAAAEVEASADASAQADATPMAESAVAPEAEVAAAPVEAAETVDGPEAESAPAEVVELATAEEAEEVAEVESADKAESGS